MVTGTDPVKPEHIYRYRTGWENYQTGWFSMTGSGKKPFLPIGLHKWEIAPHRDCDRFRRREKMRFFKGVEFSACTMRSLMLGQLFL